MAEDVHITPEGLEAVRKEHDEMVNVRRPAIVAKIKAAREFGDLSENFEYHAAKNEQGMMEARINELEAILKNHVLIENGDRTPGLVAMGSTVRFREEGVALRYLEINGQWEDHVRYGVTAEEWEQRRDELQAAWL